MTPAAAVVLAGGASARYRAAGGAEPTKLVAPLDGVPLVRRVAAAALGCRARPVVVVTGHAREAVEAALAGLDVVLAHNPGYARGLAGSLRRGLDAVPPGASGALILLGDMPLVDAALLDALLRAAERDLDADAVVPVWDGERRNPVLLRRSLFARAGGLTGDEGARRLLRDPALRVMEVPLGGKAVCFDVDEPGALNRAGAGRGSRP